MIPVRLTSRQAGPVDLVENDLPEGLLYGWLIERRAIAEDLLTGGIDGPMVKSASITGMCHDVEVTLSRPVDATKARELSRTASKQHNARVEVGALINVGGAAERERPMTAHSRGLRVAPHACSPSCGRAADVGRVSVVRRLLKHGAACQVRWPLRLIGTS